ncbi:MAG: hypothetical protein RIS52_1226 [Pseudomonadota bacterium]|jgi:PilZ domain
MDMSETPFDLKSVGLAYDGMRHSQRESLFLLGKLYFEGRPALDVRVRNLSSTGMMVESPMLGRIGDDVQIEIKGIGKVPARVAWVAERRMGLALVDPIDPRMSRQPLGTPTSAVVMDHTVAKTARRPGLKIL